MGVRRSRRGRLIRTMTFAVFALSCLLLLSCGQPKPAASAAPAGSAAATDKGPSSEPSSTGTMVPPDNDDLVSTHGGLRVKGTHVVDRNGKVFQLRGVSTHGIAWFPDFVNKEAFATWQGWGANAIRLACYTVEYGGWCEGGDQNALLETIDKGVQAARDLDMYVIVDWHVLHDQNPLVNQEQARAFFSTVTEKYGNDPHVIYEICNEPNGDTSWQDVRTYANDIIGVIRKNAPDALVICGTPTWSQDVDQVSSAPVDDKNTVYALHFYAGTHKEDLRAKAKAALDAGTPLLVSEFGVTDASGNGACDLASADEWIDFLQDNGVGYVCWSLSNKDESSALIKASCSKTSGWNEGDLSEEGTWYKGVLETFRR